jgi:hypothetical protein
VNDTEFARVKREYEQDGVSIIRAALTAEEIRNAQAAVDGVLGAKDLPPGNGWDYDVEKGRFFMGMFLWMIDAGLRRTVLDSALPSIAARLLGARKVNLFYDQLFVKEPGTESPTPWHQDQPYWAVDGEQVMSFWIALDPVTRESGAVEYIRGSHKWSRRFQPKSFAGPNKYTINPELETIPDFDAERDRHSFVSHDMAPGDVIAFHGLTVHGSGGNLTRSQRRRGYAVRYTGDDVTFRPRPENFKLPRDPGIRAGDPMDSDLFPVVYRA